MFLFAIVQRDLMAWKSVDILMLSRCLQHWGIKILMTLFHRLSVVQSSHLDHELSLSTVVLNSRD